MKILGLIKGLDVGGAETLCATLALEGQRLGHSWDIAYLASDENHFSSLLQSANVGVHLLRSSCSADLRWLPKLLALIQTSRPHVVHIHSPYVGALARPLLRALPKNARPLIVTTEHNIPSTYNRITRSLNCGTLHLNDSVITVSDVVRDSLPGHVKRKARTIVHGIDVQALHHSSTQRSESSRLSQPDSTCFTVITVANLRAQKNLICLLEAAEVIARVRNDVRFIVVGTGPMRDWLERAIRERNLDGYIKLLGYRSDVPTLLAQSDLFVLTSQGEGLPVAVMEALALGVPCVVTPVGGLPELVKDGRNGALVRQPSPTGVAAQIQTLLDDPTTRSQMSKAAREDGERLDIRLTARQVHTLYADLSKQGRGLGDWQ